MRGASWSAARPGLLAPVDLRGASSSAKRPGLLELPGRLEIGLVIGRTADLLESGIRRVALATRISREGADDETDRGQRDDQSTHMKPNHRRSGANTQCPPGDISYHFRTGRRHITLGAAAQGAQPARGFALLLHDLLQVLQATRVGACDELDSTSVAFGFGQVVARILAHKGSNPRDRRAAASVRLHGYRG